MDNRIMQVFYDVNCYPFKDKELSTRYPIVGCSFTGSHNYNKIHFYVKEIGGVNNITWVANTKLPNGRIIYQVLSTIGLDSDINQYYVEMDISSFYTQLKGDIYISLNGCDGDVEISEDGQGIQTIEAVLNTRTIVATGSIKISMNYAVQRPQGFSFQLDQYQDIIDALSDKANILNTIQVISSTSDVDLDNFEVGQLFYSIALGEQQYYELRVVNGNKQLVQIILDSANKVLRYILTGHEPPNVLRLLTQGRICVVNIDDYDYLMQIQNASPRNITLISIATQRYYQATQNELSEISDIFDTQYGYSYRKLSREGNIIYATDINSDQIELEYSTSANANEIPQRDSNGQINVPLTPTSNAHATSKKYVDDKIAEFAQNELQVVNTSEYPTLNDFLDSQGQEGYIYLYPIDNSDLSKGYYRYIWENNAWLSLGTSEIDLSDYYTKSETNGLLGVKVDKTSSANKVYITGDTGNQEVANYDDYASGSFVRRNDSGGQIYVPATPTANTHASSKKYVDDSLSSGLSGKQDTLVSGTNIKTLNGQTLLGSGNYTFDSELNDTSTNAVQNKVLKAQLDNTNAQLYQLKLEFYESVVSVESYDIDYAYYSALPLTIDSQPVIFSAGMDLIGIKGRSYAYNQQAKELNDTNWSSISATVSYSNGVATFTATSSNGRILGQPNNVIGLINGHTYLLTYTIKLTTGTTDVLTQIRYNDESGNVKTIEVLEQLNIDIFVLNSKC